jgi:hypothetical protein
MKTSLPRLSCTLLALSLLAGCATPASNVRHPKVTQVCVLSPDRPSPEVDLGLVSAIKVQLPGPDADSKYVWEIVSNNNRVLEQMGPLQTKPGSLPAGSEPTTSVSFYALKPGKSVLRFFLVRSGDNDAVPAQQCELIVHVKD